MVTPSIPHRFQEPAKRDNQGRNPAQYTTQAGERKENKTTRQRPLASASSSLDPAGGTPRNDRGSKSSTFKPNWHPHSGPPTNEERAAGLLSAKGRFDAGHDRNRRTPRQLDTSYGRLDDDQDTTSSTPAGPSAPPTGDQRRRGRTQSMNFDDDITNASAEAFGASSHPHEAPTSVDEKSKVRGVAQLSAPQLKIQLDHESSPEDVVVTAELSLKLKFTIDKEMWGTEARELYNEDDLKRVIRSQTKRFAKAAVGKVDTEGYDNEEEWKL